MEGDGVNGFSETALLAALRDRHSNGGAGRYAFLTHVRTGAAWDQQEIDAVAVALWPSENHDVHAFEVKCSRSDWLREIKPSTHKSERTRVLCDTFTVVAPLGVVREGELPDGWGLIQATLVEGAVKLRQKAKPARLVQVGYPGTLPRGFVVCLLRASGCVPGMTSGLKRERVTA